MQIIHRVSFNSSPSKQRTLAGFGIIVPDGGLVAFDVDETHEMWPALSDWIVEVRALDIVSTKYSKQELAEAQYLMLMPEWHHGYPQPEERSSGYRQATYDLSEACEHCGMGMKQKAPFQMKGEPRWGRRSILQLNWIFEEYFVKPDIWSKVFLPHGIGCRSVTDRRGNELRTVVQLSIEEEVGIASTGLTPERCERCTRTKYLPHRRGPFPALTEEPVQMLARTREYFGSAGKAYRGVFISQQLARAMMTQRVLGASFEPIHVGGTPLETGGDRATQ